MVDVKEKDILIGEGDGSDLEQSSAVKEMLKILERAKKSACMIFNVSFQWQLESAKQPK